MELIILLTIATLAFLTLAAAVGLIVFGGNAFGARIASITTAGGVSKRGVAMLTPQLREAVLRLGGIAGKGSLTGQARNSVRFRLAQAGFYAERSVEAFYGIRALCALGFGAAALLVGAIARFQHATFGIIVLMAALAVGLYLPNFLIARRIAARSQAIRLGLPDVVDLMVVCVEAGGTLASALQRVEAEFRDLHPVLSEQFRIVLLEMQAGSSRAAALQRLSERAPSEEISTLVTLLIQSEQLGASVANTMRAFAEQTRESRYLDAERRAGELPVKMAFPLVLFIFPSLMTVIFTPLILRFARVLLKV